MELNELTSSLRDISNMRSASHFKRTICKMAAQRLEAQQTRIAQLEAELKEERYRHDRVQDFEVAEAQELAKLRQERRWIPVGERLPDVIDSYIVVIKYKYDHEKEYSYGTDVATYNPYEKAYIDDCWNTYNDWDEGQQHLHVTHWMPLPEPPEEVG